MMIEFVNIGSEPNSNDSDTMRDAFKKVNNNFKYMQSFIDSDLDFKNIEWNGICDTYDCIKDVNENFGKLKNI